MSRVVLVEGQAYSGSAGSDAEMVACSAVAEFSLQPHEHRLLTDIAPETALTAVEGEYWRAQVGWLRDLERFWAERSPSLQTLELRPGWALGYPLKLLVDPVFVRALQSKAITQAGWSSIEHLVDRDGGLLADVLGRRCASGGIEYRLRTSAATGARPRAARMMGFGQRCARAARLALLTSPRRRSAPRPSGDARRLLLLSVGYDLGPLASANAAAGGETLVVDGNRLVRLTRFGPRLHTPLSGPTTGDQAEWERVAAEFRDDNRQLEWPERWFDEAVVPLVVDRVADWTRDELPRVVARARAFRDVFAQHEFDAVVAPYLVSPEDAGTFAAARATSTGPRTMVVAHGDTVFSSPSLDFEFLAADILAVPSAEIADHVREREDRYADPGAEVVIGSYRWRAAAKRRAGRRLPVRSLVGGGRAARFDADKPVLVYLMTAMSGDLRYLNNAWYPDEWLFRLEQTIVDALARHAEFNVIVKLFPSGNAVDPIAGYVEQLGIEHVMTSAAPFARWLPRADRVVADLASTGVYESVLAGLPTLALVWRNHAVRPGARQQLGAVLQEFSTFSDAASIVDHFVSAESPPVISLRPEGTDLLASVPRGRR